MTVPVIVYGVRLLDAVQILMGSLILQPTGVNGGALSPLTPFPPTLMLLPAG